MLRRRRLRASAVAVLAAWALVGCTSGGGVSTPTPTPTALTEEEAYAAAEEAFRAYIEALNKVDTADSSTFDPLFALSTGTQNAQDRKQYSEWHANGWRQVGEAAVILVQPVSAAETLDSVELASCIDVATVDLLDASGASMIDANRVDIQSVEVTVRHIRSSSWKVENFSGRDGGPACS